MLVCMVHQQHYAAYYFIILNGYELRQILATKQKVSIGLGLNIEWTCSTNNKHFIWRLPVTRWLANLLFWPETVDLRKQTKNDITLHDTFCLFLLYEKISDQICFILLKQDIPRPYNNIQLLVHKLQFVLFEQMKS